MPPRRGRRRVTGWCRCASARWCSSSPGVSRNGTSRLSSTSPHLRIHGQAARSEHPRQTRAAVSGARPRRCTSRRPTAHKATSRVRGRRRGDSSDESPAAARSLPVADAAAAESRDSRDCRRRKPHCRRGRRPRRLVLYISDPTVVVVETPEQATRVLASRDITDVMVVRASLDERGLHASRLDALHEASPLSSADDLRSLLIECFHASSYGDAPPCHAKGDSHARH